jgi:hypothetical protein
MATIGESLMPRPLHEKNLNKFIYNENLKHLRNLLMRSTDDAECERIVKLIEEEEAKKFGQ